MNNNNIIEVYDLTKKYGNVTAINEINFTVKKGEILGFLGPNGAGKTTTMKILTCFMPATSGTAKINGYDIHTHSLEVRKMIGYLPENLSLYPEMTVKSYLEFVAKLKDIERNKIKERVEEVMRICWISNVEDTIISRLSKGYKQRVGLAQSLIHEPELLILDEPTEGLDPKQIIETRELIKSLAEEHTVILCSHILPEVSMICKRIAIINDGKIVAIDTPENLHNKLQPIEKVYLQVKGENEKIINAIKKIEGIVDIIKEVENVFIIKYKKGLDLRSQIAECIIKNNWDLIEIKSLGMSLEEIFLKITTEEENVEEILSK